MKTAAQALESYVRAQIPRFLTHLDRDPDSPTYGCFDRNFWHYKIQDFSSAILQQSVLALYAFQSGVIQLQNQSKDQLRLWAQSSLDFWAKLPTSHGGFNEYYPFESGYPPTAFSLHAVGYVLPHYQLTDKICRQIQRAVDFLSDNFEKEALNQQAAGVAALALCRKLEGIHVETNLYTAIVSRFFDAQQEEGWFPEYGGPDLGYLTVTIDMLWDYYDVTNDSRALHAINKAIEYLCNFVAPDNSVAEICNSRNTDYVVPYGLARSGMGNPLAAEFLRRVFSTADESSHFLASIDDRYHLHYVYNSCARSLQYIHRLTTQSVQLPCDVTQKKYFPVCGNFTEHRAGKYSLFCSVKKGGVLKVVSSRGTVGVDYGWRCNCNEKLYVTNFWSEKYTAQLEEFNDQVKSYRIQIEGILIPVTWFRPSPLKHIIVRAVSFIFGNRLMSWLKKLLIFRKPKGSLILKRTIDVGEKVVLRDIISGSSSNAVSWRASRPSARHVSSAGGFLWEELSHPVLGQSIRPAGKEVETVIEIPS